MRGRLENKEKKSVEILEEDFLNSISIEWGMMETPSVSIVLPSRYAKYITGNTIVHLLSDGWHYAGYVDNKRMSIGNSTVIVDTVHFLHRLSKRKLPTNITLKSLPAKEVLEHAWSLWREEERIDEIVSKFSLNYVDSYAELYEIEYEFSNESILEFLTKVCEKTPSLYWRVSRYDPFQIDFGVFGSHKNILINEDTSLLEIKDVIEDYSEVTNVAVVMSDKSDSGASSLTLRDIFYNKRLMLKGFPVIKTGYAVNNQRHYQYPQIPQFAPEIIGEEFALLDEEGIAMEAGEFYWGTIVENDTQAIAEDNREITNKDRLASTQQLYRSAIRKLINSRRKVLFQIEVSPLAKKSCQIGDKVMFTLNEGVWELTSCTKYYEKVLKTSDWFYITSIVDSYGDGNSYTQVLELSKYLYSERDIKATT